MEDSNFDPYVPAPDQDESPPSQSGQSSVASSGADSRPPKEKHRVQFKPGGESLDVNNIRSAFDIQEGVPSSSAGKEALKPPVLGQRINPIFSRHGGSSLMPDPPDSMSVDITQIARSPMTTMKMKPSFARLPSTELALLGEFLPVPLDEAEEVDGNSAWEATSERSARSAQEKAARLSRRIGTLSAPSSAPSSPRLSAQSLGFEDIPMENLQRRNKYGRYDDTDDETDDDDSCRPDGGKKKRPFVDAAKELVRYHKSRAKRSRDEFKLDASFSHLRSGHSTPTDEQGDEYIRMPPEYQEGFLSTILKLYNQEGIAAAVSGVPKAGVPLPAHRRESTEGSFNDASSSTYTDRVSPSSSGQSTPKHTREELYENPNPSLTGSIVNLLGSATTIARHVSSAIKPSKRKQKRSKTDETVAIQSHLSNLMTTQSLLRTLCKALMMYGAPPHRLEEYMVMSARALKIRAQFLYIPGNMIISIDDAGTRTAQVKLVSTPHGVNLSKLLDLHEIYTEVVHDHLKPELALYKLSKMMERKSLYRPWLLVFVYGLASASVGPFAFGARPIDLPISFILGTLLGIMQLILAPRFGLYSHIFEISAAILTSFLARVFGSLQGGNLFCFSALAQSSIALILPGYTVLCSSLELQSKNIIAGSVRMVYAIIYSLFLGYGITIGTALYGAMDNNATVAVTCTGTMPSWYPFLFVPLFTFCLIVINQGRWKQMPVMIILACVGYLVNHFSAIPLASNAQVPSTLAALLVSLLANLYSQWYQDMAAALILPAIFVQVPSGLAASGSLVSGVTSAMQITHQSVDGKLANGTATVDVTNAGTGGQEVNTMLFNVGYSMIQVSIGITVGLFSSGFIVSILPFKKKSGLFSF